MPDVPGRSPSPASDAIDVLILEDDAESRAALKAWLQQQRLDVREAATIAEAQKRIAERLPDLALLDVILPDGSGLLLLKELVPAGVDVVMVSGQTTIQDAIGALRLGASDFLPKPADIPRLTAIVENVRRRRRMHTELRDLRGQLKNLGRFGALVGASAAMQGVYECIERVARTDETVFLTGPTGTGKEVTAATIHALSHRKNGPYVAVNCGAIAASLIESEFFGHERGAFTGADRQRMGVFERAHGGTLFLDEITEMPIDLQVKLLRVLETRQVTRVGGNKAVDFDVRILVATNREPKDAVANGKLREDLMYRLFVFPIDLPPLAARDGDVRLLAQEFLDRVNREYEASKRFTEDALRRLEAHTWPGNVRELANVVRRAFLMAAGEEVLLSHLPLPAAAGMAAAVGAGTAPVTGAAPPVLGMAPGMTIAAAEKLLIEATLLHLGGDKRKAAEVLGISLKTLYTRLQVYGASAAGAP
ncbi:MAG TPA: sigma-54 dependent transcriptional regulator [Planctomycetota bacterium]|nr:sigma-54 dependent transcriptional regulator [Planctomycetota bacterium]